MEKKFFENFFFPIFLIIPISIIVGSTVSLINIVLVDLLFLFVLIYNKEKKFLSHYSLKILIILYIYLLFNSIISIDREIGLARNLGFIRLIIFFIFINYFFIDFHKKKFFDYWSILLLIFTFDVCFEFFSGANIFGWGAREYDGVPQAHGRRIMSFFKDEPVAGAFISGFIFILFGNLLEKFSNKKIIPFIFLLILLFGIILTGERSNSIKVIIGSLIFFLLIDNYSIKKKIVTLFIFFGIITTLIFYSDYLSNRYIGQIIKYFNSKDVIQKSIDQNIYIKIYKSSYKVFENYPLFGVGNKNYRVETCNKKKWRDYGYTCTTHPHQVYFELLSEHGVIGSVIILSIFFFLMFQILKEILRSRNYIQTGSFIYVLINFIPILPSGSFFNDFGLTLFWINFSIMFACNKKTNIFTFNSKI
tara:strand:+ start:619 stop:1875 length:1257 start_codon:yes stop_codon:yes gene_type:complete